MDNILPPSNGTPPSTGLGENLFQHERGTARDTRLVRRAIANGWPIPAELRAEIVEKLAGVIRDPDTSPRELIAASKCIVGADGLNLQAERIAIAAEQPVPATNTGVLIVQESDDWYGTKNAAANVRAAIDSDPEFIEFLRLKACGTLPVSSTPTPN